MKMKTMALTLLLLAGVSEAAMAQDRGGREANREQRMERREQRMERREARQPGTEGARTPQVREGRRDREGGFARQDGSERWRGGERQGDQARRGDSGRDAGRDTQRDSQRDGGGQRWERDRQGGGEIRRDRPDGGRPDARPDVRRDDNRSGWRREDPRWRDDGRRDGARSGYFRRDGRDAPRWDARRYPRIYSSPYRYRVPAYRPPSGFYVRSWGFGEVLPRGWYTPEYRLMDWWAYDLPMPPPGFSWVRVGPDVLLVDDFTGRVVQVVRYVFW